MPRAVQRAVIFDFDGVVADSWKLHETCWREVLARHGLKVPAKALAKSLGLSSQETAELIAKELDSDVSAKALGEEKSVLFAERAASELQPMSGAPEALRRVAGEFTVAVAAIRRAAGVNTFLERFDLGGVSQVVTMDDLSGSRDLTDLLEETGKRLKIPAGRCVVIEDARQGIFAAKRSGMKVVAFDSNPKLALDSSTADAVISSLDELVPELINSVAVG